jgi:hypothetical protein
MNYDQPPRTNWVKVVLIILGSLAVLFIALMFSAYYVLMHTAVPFRMVAGVITEAGTNQNLRIDGVSGSISKGFVVKAITWGEKDKDANQIKDVRVLYGSFWDIMSGRKIVIKQVHVGKAHLDVTGIEQVLWPTNSVGLDGMDENDEEGTNVTVQTPAMINTNLFVSRHRYGRLQRHQSPGFAQNRLIQVDEFSIEDVFLTNQTTGFGLSVPAIQWKGFKAQGQNVELGQLTIDSDRLKVETKEGEEVEVGGQKIKFQTRLEGTVLPLLHKSVRQPIAFTIDAVHTGTNLAWRLSSFDGKLEAYQAGDDTGFLHCRDTDLKAYFQAPLPEHLTANLAMTHKGTKQIVKLGKGSFNLGQSRFEIQPQQWEKKEMPSTNHLTALGKAGDATVTYHLFLPHQPWALEQRLTCEPAMQPQELLAKVYYAKTFDDLSEADQKVVQTNKSAFSGWPKDSVKAFPAAELEKQ